MTRRAKRAVAAAMTAVLVAATAAGATTVKSLYTTLALADCKVVRKHEHGNAYACPGLEGWPVWFAEGDDRTYVSYGAGGEKLRAAGQTLGAFNSPFAEKAPRATIEWRFVRRDGRPVPYATILRFHTSRDGRRGDVIVVTRVAAGEACQIARIDAFANPDAIALARSVADEEARTFDCRQEPRIVGRRGRSPM
jgi:hypothetical protein